MKNYGCLVPTAAFCGMALFSVTYSCPMFVEFFADPKDVSDTEGEYVEIRLDEGVDRSGDGNRECDSGGNRAESLYVRLESKEILAYALPPDAERLLLVHDAESCPQREGLACGSLGSLALPNSRETVWKVWSGVCMDSVVLPQPKTGKALQRVGLTDEWVYTAGTMGRGDSDYELGVEEDSLLTLVGELGAVGRSLRMTEVHHCPEEPMPEWVELYNASEYSLPLDMFRFCDRGGALGAVGDSIRPSQVLLVSKDTMALRASLGFSDVRLVQVALGYLNNTEGALNLCFRDDVVDSVQWDKSTVACPSGFNPLTRLRDWTPGFLPQNAKKVLALGAGTATGNVSASGTVPASGTVSALGTVSASGTVSALGTVPASGTVPALGSAADGRLFEYKFSSRVVSKKGSALRVRVESEYDVVLSLLDSAGRRVWKTVVPAQANEWVKVPVQEHLGIGAGFVSLAVGEAEDVIGILVRP